MGKIDWYYLGSNKSIPLGFFEKHVDCISRFSWRALCENTSIPIDFFEKHLDKLDYYSWQSLCGNNFSCYLDNIAREDNINKMSNVLVKIKTIYYVPCNIISCVPRGGLGYLGILSKYD